MNGNKHITTAQRGASGKDPTSWAGQPTFTQKQLYRVPEELIKELFNTITNDLKNRKQKIKIKKKQNAR